MMEKFTNTVRGGVNPFKINGLVADAISDELATRLLDKTYRKNKDVIIHVSAQGNDATGDGTEAKPFATVNKAVNYAYNNAYTNYHVVIKFLSDYTQTNMVTIHHVNSGRYFIFQANGHKVTLSRMSLQLGNFSFEGINFVQTDPTQELLLITNKAQCYLLGDCTIEVMPDAQLDIIQTWNGSLYMDHRSNITFTSKGVPKNVFLFLSAHQGFTAIHNTARVTLDANMSHIGFARTHVNSCTFIDNKSTITAPSRPQAYSYEVKYGAHFSTHGRGKLPNLGDLTLVDSSSSIS